MIKRATLRGRLLKLPLPLSHHNRHNGVLATTRFRVLFLNQHSFIQNFNSKAVSPDLDLSSIPREIHKIENIYPGLDISVYTQDLAKLDVFFKDFPELIEYSNYNKKRWLNFDVAGISNMKGILGGNGICSINVVFKRVPSSNAVECRYRLRIKERIASIDVSAIGTGKANAQNRAMMLLLLKIHEEGLVPHAFPFIKAESKKKQPPSSSITPAPLLSDEDARTAIVDIFNYAAKYTHELQYSVQAKTPEEKEDPKSPKKRQRKSLFTINVRLPELSLHVKAEGTNLQLVETRACVAFKQEIERYHATNTASPMISPSNSISLDNSNADNFIDFYKDQYDPNLKFIEKRNLHGGFEIQAFSGETPIGAPFRKGSSINIVGLSRLALAMLLLKKTPALLAEYGKIRHELGGRYVAKAKPLSFSIQQGSMALMARTIEAAENAGLPSILTNVSAKDADEGFVGSDQPTMRSTSKLKALKRSQELLRWFDERSSRHKKPSDLPMNTFAPQVLEHFQNNQFSIIIGETGSGKTTQIPQIILNDYIKSGRGGFCHVICTQPRRIAAISVAERVASERGQALGDQVGYHIALDKQLPRVEGGIVYCTTGILLNQLMHHADSVLDSVTHIVIDEVHERSIDIDFVLVTLKDAVQRRIRAGQSVPKICFMSATMDAEAFEAYFSFTHDNKGLIPCPTLRVPGRTFPVETFHLDHILDDLRTNYSQTQLSALDSDDQLRYLKSEERFARQNGSPDQESDMADINVDWGTYKPTEQRAYLSREEGLVPVDLAVLVVAHLLKTTDRGAILVFLPSTYTIEVAATMLSTQKILGVDFRDGTKYKIFPLHSNIPSHQSDVFEEPREGCRKIILATNIAETSVTIPDVQYVIDTGKHREQSYDTASGVSSLPHKWISKSNSKQRKGRAGRVQKGNYYALFSDIRHEHLRDEPVPEILRSNLQSTCLYTKRQGHVGPIEDFLGAAIDPPDPQAVQASIRSLKNLGALTDTQDITPLGRLLASLPVNPPLGKMIVYGIVFRCLDPMIILGAAASNGNNIFTRPYGMEKKADNAKKSFAKRSNSDHIALLEAFRALRTLKSSGGWAFKRFAKEKFLSTKSFDTINDATINIKKVLRQQGLIPQIGFAQSLNELDDQFGGQSLNENSFQPEVLKAVLVSGLHPNIGTRASIFTYQIPAFGKTLAKFHPSSMNHPDAAPKGERPRDRPDLPQIVAFNELVLGGDLCMRDTTEITPLMVALFGGVLRHKDPDSNELELDSWLPLHVSCSNDDRKLITDAHTAQILSRFHDALNQMKEYVVRNLILTRDLADDKICEIFSLAIRQLVHKEQDLTRLATMHEYEYTRTLRTGTWRLKQQDQFQTSSVNHTIDENSNLEDQKPGGGRSILRRVSSVQTETYTPSFRRLTGDDLAFLNVVKKGLSKLNKDEVSSRRPVDRAKQLERQHPEQDATKPQFKRNITRAGRKLFDHKSSNSAPLINHSRADFSVNLSQRMADQL